MAEADRQLIRRMQEGDPAAFEQFAEDWYPKIVKWAAVRTSRDKVMDYAQSVWVHLTEDGCRRLLRWRGFYAEGNPNSLAGFLKTVTTRKVISLYRVDNKHWLDFGGVSDVVDEDGRIGSNPLDTVEGEQIKIEFQGCFGELPRKDKRMLIMKWNGRRDEAIARFFRQMTANNVRQRRYQMVRKLRECLSAKLPAYFSND